MFSRILQSCRFSRPDNKARSLARREWRSFCHNISHLAEVLSDFGFFRQFRDVILQILLGAAVGAKWLDELDTETVSVPGGAGPGGTGTGPVGDDYGGPAGALDCSDSESGLLNVK